MPWNRVCQLEINMEPCGKPAGLPSRVRGHNTLIIDWKYRTGPRRGQYKPAWYFYLAVKAAAAEKAPGQTLDCPIRLTTWAFFSRPKRLMRAKDPSGPTIRHTTKPDADNINKLIKDSITAVGDGKHGDLGAPITEKFWRDDCVVCSEHAEKLYVGKGCEPFALILIDRLEGEESFGAK